MKKSRETFKVYEGEIKNLNLRAQELVALKKKVLKGKPQLQSEEEIEKLQKAWTVEKEELLAEKEKLLQLSNELQEKIKVAKQAKA